MGKGMKIRMVAALLMALPRVASAQVAVADALETKPKDFLAPLFIAISGSAASFSVVDSMELLGPDMSRARIRHAIEVLGGVSNKAMKRLEKEYQQLDGER